MRPVREGVVDWLPNGDPAIEWKTMPDRQTVPGSLILVRNSLRCRILSPCASRAHPCPFKRNRNPMNPSAMRLRAQMEERRTDAKRAPEAERWAHLIDRLSRLVETMLDTSGLAKGELRLERSIIDLHDLVRATVGQLSGIFAASQSTVHLRADRRPLPSQLVRRLGSAIVLLLSCWPMFPRRRRFPRGDWPVRRRCSVTVSSTLRSVFRAAQRRRRPERPGQHARNLV